MAGKLSQPGCHSNTGTSSRTGRSLVKLEVLLPENNSLRMRGSIRKQEKKNNKNGKKILGRQSSFLQFGSKPVKPCFSTAKEGVDAALRKFKELWAAKASSPQAALQVLGKIRKDYPHLDVNKLFNDPGHVPGVDVHRCFSFRAELCLVGLHRPPQAGIYWTEGFRFDGDLICIALSIVVSGGYEDDLDEGETLTYTGEGGKDQTTGRQNENQKREGGNLALQNSCTTKNSVRVIRGRKDPNSPSGMTYTYDGLYKVVSAKPERGISGFEVFKFRLVREVHGQPPLRWYSPVPSPRNRISRGFESPPRSCRRVNKDVDESEIRALQGQQNNSAIARRHGKAPHIRKGRQFKVPIRRQEFEVDKEVRKFINAANERKAAFLAGKEGAKLRVVPGVTVDATKISCKKSSAVYLVSLTVRFP